MRLQNTPKLNLFGFRIVFASMKMGQNSPNLCVFSQKV